MSKPSWYFADCNCERCSAFRRTGRDDYPVPPSPDRLAYRRSLGLPDLGLNEATAGNKHEI